MKKTVTGPVHTPSINRSPKVAAAFGQSIERVYSVDQKNKEKKREELILQLYTN